MGPMTPVSRTMPEPGGRWRRRPRRSGRRLRRRSDHLRGDSPWQSWSSPSCPVTRIVGTVVGSTRAASAALGRGRGRSDRSRGDGRPAGAARSCRRERAHLCRFGATSAAPCLADGPTGSGSRPAHASGACPTGSRPMRPCSPSRSPAPIHAVERASTAGPPMTVAVSGVGAIGAAVIAYLASSDARPRWRRS